MSNTFTIQVTGQAAVIGGLERAVARAADLREMEQPLTEQYTKDNTRNLLSEGASVGGWQLLTARTLADKARKGYGGKRIEERTGRLFRSLTAPGADGFFSHFGEFEAVLGSDVEYALPQHAGTDNLPARQLIPDPDVKAYAQIFQSHAARVAQAEGFTVL